MNEMLFAACESFQQAGQNTGDCSWAQDGDCGWSDPALMDNFIEPPWDEPIAKFRAAAEAKINGYSRLSVATFREHCGTVFSTEMCLPFCNEFSDIVKSLVSAESGKVLGNTDTLDGLKAERAAKARKKKDAEGEKDACAAALTQLDAFRAQLSKLSGDYK